MPAMRIRRRAFLHFGVPHSLRPMGGWRGGSHNGSLPSPRRRRALCIPVLPKPCGTMLSRVSAPLGASNATLFRRGHSAGSSVSACNVMSPTQSRGRPAGQCCLAAARHVSSTLLANAHPATGPWLPVRGCATTPWARTCRLLLYISNTRFAVAAGSPLPIARVPVAQWLTC